MAAEAMTSSSYELLKKQLQPGQNNTSTEGLISSVETTTAYSLYAYNDGVHEWDRNVSSSGTVSGMSLCPIEQGNSTGYGYDFYATAQMVTGLFIYPTFCFPGLVGNILTVVVLSQRNMLTSTNAFLSALAVSDSIKLINDILYFFVTLFFNIDPVLGNLSYGYLYPYAHFIFSMSVCVSSWLTVSVAVERYILVCHPTRARNMWSRKRAVTLCCAIYVVMTSLALPSAFRYRTIRCFDAQLNASRLEVELTEMWKDEFFVTSYTWAQNLLRSIIPLVVLVVLNVCIIRAVRRTKIKKKRKNSRHRVTIMMIVVILTFLICITPDAILSTVFGRGYHEAGMVTKGIREITDTLLTINAAVNFIIYCALNKVFRKSFTHLCCPHSKRKGDGWITEMDESVYRRFSEAKLSSNNNHSATRQDSETPSGSYEFAPSTPKSAISSDGNHSDNNRFRYHSLPGGTSSPESPGFSSERLALFAKQELCLTQSDGCVEKCNQRRRQHNRKSVTNQQRSSWGDRQDHRQKHKSSSHGLKKSRNSVKCNRGKRTTGSNNGSCAKNSDNYDAYQNEVVTYVPKEEFQNVMRRVSSGKQNTKFPSSNDTNNSDQDKNNKTAEKVQSEKNFVLDLKSNERRNIQIDSSPSPFPLSPDSSLLSPYSPHSHDSPETINSDVILLDDRCDDFKNDFTSPDCDISKDNTLSSVPVKRNSVVYDDNTIIPKLNGTIPMNEKPFKDPALPLPSSNDNNYETVEDYRNPESVEDSSKESEWSGSSDQTMNSNKLKKRALTVSFSDC